jgi:hypothetical protein
MAARWILMVFALAALGSSTGCRTWCERNYPCPPACTPCCYPAPTAHAPPAIPAVPAAPVANWGNPTGRPLNCTCTCQ